MAQTTASRNPFQLMLDPEVVLAAVKRSERLGQLNSRLCRPLDRPAVPGSQAAADAPGDDAKADDWDE